MRRLTPISWRELIRRLRALGFDGPYQEGKHPYMQKRDLVVTIPNPHKRQIGVDLLARILKLAKISRDAWLKHKA